MPIGTLFFYITRGITYQMKSKIYSILIIGALGGLCSINSSCTERKTEITSKHAYIELKDTVYDFGIIDATNSKASHTFKLKNKGQEPLVVHKVETSCHCTSANYSETPIESGKSGQIEVIFDATSSNIGSFAKTVYIYTNTQQGLNKVTIKGKVKPA